MKGSITKGRRKRLRLTPKQQRLWRKSASASVYARKREPVQLEQETHLLAGDAGKAELLRRVHAGVDGGYSDSPIYQEEVRRLRYSGGGLHDRLREAAMPKVQDNTHAYHLKRCLTGVRMHALRYRYEA